MRIVLAFDKFKGSLTAAAACAAARRGLLRAHPGAHILAKPMADGGDGTAAVLKAALGGKWIPRRVTGPLPLGGRASRRAAVRQEPRPPIAARYLWIPGKKLAAIEMAAASGLTLLHSRQRNPLCTTTYGTGELIADAMQRGARRILLGVGGSATVDGGVGAAMALGWRFLDDTGNAIGFGGRELKRIAQIIPPPITTHHLPLTIQVLCDVDNPLCGRHGAARVFGPQKGATPAMVARLDAGLRHLADLVKAQLGKDIRDIPGAGAAGGLAAGAVAFFNAQLVPGAETIAETIGLPVVMRGADWVMTGEGCFDEQSLRGKVVSGVVALARRYRVPVTVLAGTVQLSKARWRRAGVMTALPIQPAGMSTAVAIARAEKLLAVAAKLQSSPKHSASRVRRRRSNTEYE